MKYDTSQFHDWIYKNSLAEYKKYSKILKNPKDDLEEIGFRISSVRCSFFDCKKNTTIYVIGTLSNNGKCPKNAFVKDYEANIKINGQTPEIMYIEFNGTSSELENHGIGSLGLDYLKILAKEFHCKYLKGKIQRHMYTTEQYKKVLHFYLKNGFTISEDDTISYEIK